MIRLTLVIALILLLTLPAVAQENEWTLREDCAVYTASDIPYDGTILATGYGGLHGINSDWETPHVVANSARYSGGSLSPNQHWYAVFEKEIFYSESFNHEHFVEAIHVYSTFDDTIVYSIPWQNSWLQMWGYREIFWLDNATLLYEYSEEHVHDLDELVVINPFEDIITAWNANVDILDGGSGFQRQYIQFPSPNFSKTIYYRYDAERNLRYWALYDIISGEVLVELNVPSNAVFEWSPDSSRFVGEVFTSEEQRVLIHFDAEGNQLEIIHYLDEEQIRYPYNIHFSNDGQYIAFKAQDSRLFIANMQTQEVINTCLVVANGFSWSPDDSQIAVLEPQWGTKNVYIFDLEDWAYHAVALHIVENASRDRIIGWRND